MRLDCLKEWLPDLFYDDMWDDYNVRFFLDEMVTEPIDKSTPLYISWCRYADGYLDFFLRPCEPPKEQSPDVYDVDDLEDLFK